jgi:Zn-dependent protease with chaperone function
VPVAAPSPYKPIPGPVDRVTFFTMQRRHRRASWRFSALAIVAVFLTGLPLSILITPLLYAIALLVGEVTSARWLAQLHDLPLLFPHALAFLAGKQVVVPLREILIVSGVLVAPGAILLLGFWAMIRVVFRRAGVGGVLLTLGARDPNLNDFEERQLMNVVEEMAIAAGVPPPRVMLLDAAASGGAANAAAVGWSISDATVVVTRPLLDGLSRDETQAIIGRLIGAVGNGDLKIALIILSIYQTMGVVSLLLNAVFGFRAWRILFRFVRLAILPHGAAEQDAVMTALARAADSDEDIERFTSRHSNSGCLSLVALPIQWSAMSIDMIVGLSSGLFVGQVIGAMWKRRQLLADATAVQLTRNPDGLASAVERLSRLPVAVPKAAPVSHLFAAWWGSSTRDDNDTSSATALSRSMNVSADRRLKALRAMGAHIALTTRKPSLVGAILMTILLGPFLVFIVGLMAVVMVLVMGLDLLFMMLFLLAIYGLSRLITTYGPHLVHDIQQQLRRIR